MINVCFGLHDGDGKYSKFVGVTMASIFENTAAPVTIHILHDATLTIDNRDKFIYLAGRYGQRVKFYNVDELCPDEIKFLREKLAVQINSRFSIGTFYRLLIKKFLRAGKAIYLDADIIVNLDIAELWRQDMKNFAVAAVPEMQATFGQMITDKFLLKSGRVKLENYFCAGVTMFNLDAFGEKFFRDAVQFLVDNPACESNDQDILNAFFAANYLKLEQKFDSFVLAEQRANISAVAQKIYHYAGNAVGLNLSDPFNRLWMNYFAKTPWFDENIVDKFGAELRKDFDRNSLMIQQMMKLCAGHNRAFFVEPRNVSAVKNAFAVRDDEPIIEIRDMASLDELVAKMTELRGQKLFFTFYKDYSPLKNYLEERGFAEYMDFVNGMMFLTRKQSGIEYDEWSIIRKL